jgi:hypothetical protein
VIRKCVKRRKSLKRKPFWRLVYQPQFLTYQLLGESFCRKVRTVDGDPMLVRR